MNTYGKTVSYCMILLLMKALTAHTHGTEEIRIETIKVAEGLYMMSGSGGAGNMGVSVGDDGVFLIDDQFAPFTDAVTAALKAISERPVKFLLNTHYHPDHTGGNENFGRSGTTILAHDNVRESLMHDHLIRFFNLQIPAAPAAALPVITFSRDMTFHLNGGEARALHLPHAHTNGDVVLHFTTLNAIHVGDIFFENMYPFIDLDAGGSIEGTIAAVKRILTMIDDETRVIPGHGPLSNKAGLEAYVTMLVTIRDTIAAAIAAGRSQEDIIAAKPTARFDTRYGGGSFVNPDQFTEAVYRSLSQPVRAHNTPLTINGPKTSRSERAPVITSFRATSAYHDVQRPK